MTSAVLILSALLAQQSFAPPKPVIDNERVRVWAKTSMMGAPALDTVMVYGTAGVIEAQLLPKGGAAATDIVLSPDQPKFASLREASLMVELKDHAVAALENTSGLPPAFPRPGIKQLLDTPRVTVWDYSWTLGQPTPMHFHDKDVVVMFLQDGDLESTTPDGQKTVNEYTPGTIRFNARNRTHFETLVRGTQRAIIVELK
jgi:hypothetical protein